MALAVSVIAVGVLAVGAQSFASLMVSHGESAAAAHDMFQRSVGNVFLGAVGVGVAASLLLAAYLARRLTRPLRVVSEAADRLAAGDLSARAPALGLDELDSLAASFNQMAAGLERQGVERRELIANFAHELRTPLTNLHGYLEALREGVMTPDPELFASLREEVERLQRLSASLDTLAEALPGEHRGMQPAIDLSAAIDTAVELVRPAFRRASISVEMALPQGLDARVHPDQVAHVMGNLLQNAARYTPRGGRVRVVAARQDGAVVVSVVNTGEPIPADDLPRLFERFYRVEKSRDRTRGGAGIGLAIVKQMVESAGGRVGAESGDGRTRFWFSLPGA